jgi:succinyl-CoA synthetase alpha subunit
MGHAGAIFSSGTGTARAKIDAMRVAGVHVCDNHGGFGAFCARIFSGLY